MMMKPSQIDLEPDVLELGDCGPNVAQLQAKLASFECYRGEINGQFDLLTQQALKKYQTHNELSESGYFGAETWYSMTFWKEEENIPLVGAFFAKLMSLKRITSFMSWAKQTMKVSSLRREHE